MFALVTAMHMSLQRIIVVQTSYIRILLFAQVIIIDQRFIDKRYCYLQHSVDCLVILKDITV